MERNASPLEPQELFLEQLLQRVPEQVVKDALEKLNVDLAAGAWMSIPNARCPSPCCAAGLTTPLPISS